MVDNQLNLNLEVKHDASLSDFAGPGWLAIIDAVRQLHVSLIHQLYIFGSPDTGKSHLLSAICESFIDMGQTAINLSLSDLLYTDVQVLSSLESFDLIAIDDVDAIVGHEQWQEALFHLINRSHEGQRRLLFAADRPTNQLFFSLRDLKTRLAQAPSFKVPDGHNLADRKAMLESILRRRGWQFHADITGYLLAEGPHNTGAMLRVLSHLQPMFANMLRVNISKSSITEAMKIIDEQTLLAELEDIHEQTQQEAIQNQNFILDY